MFVFDRLKTECPLADDALQFVFGDFNFRLDVKSLIKVIMLINQPKKHFMAFI